MPDATTEQTTVFNRMLPQLIRDYGPTWVVMVDADIKGHFPEFEDAAKFAIENFPAAEFLIRHTQEKAVEFTYIATDG